MTGVGGLQHFFALTLANDILLYKGEAEAAWNRCEQHWKKVTHFVSPLHSDRFTIHLWQVRGRCAAAAAASVSEQSRRRTLLAEVRLAAGKIANRKTQWGSGFVFLYRAVLACAHGDMERCLELLACSQAAFEAADMPMFEKSVEYVRGGIIGGTVGAKMVESVETFMKKQGVLRPDRIAQMYAPGLLNCARQSNKPTQHSLYSIEAR